MKTLKEAIEIKNLIEKQDKCILDLIYSMLFNILNEEYEDLTVLKKQYKLWENLLNDEFTFNYPFGNIEYETLEKINKGFKEEGFEIGSIISNDIYENKKGLEITFKKHLEGEDE